MGLSFITEGAIPFAASDPLRIIPPSIVGAAAAGALSMLFGCGLEERLIGNICDRDHGSCTDVSPARFLAGALISMLGIVLLKKPLEKKTQIEKQ